MALIGKVEDLHRFAEDPDPRRTHLPFISKLSNDMFGIEPWERHIQKAMDILCS